ncbi:hypothetical protein Pan216_38900 [Planctomycetes bacterium Pan216]|uniref:DUF4280 domain-containing protein n=1 Tax=Kolteria novifilia TaxID=2527975 RepID=A0A518B7R4_9BACT|nr:hypothetical protein Pan216_38900 [Planctomycetes bacterium Pan216]
MGKPIVVEGAKCACNQEEKSTQKPLKVTSQNVETINDKTVATIMDCIPIANVPSFGTCKILTLQANGAKIPCVPVAAGTWSKGSKMYAINGQPALLESDKLRCAIGGTITVKMNPDNKNVVSD